MSELTGEWTELMLGSIGRRFYYDRHIVNSFEGWLQACVHPSTAKLEQLEAGPGPVIHPADLKWQGILEGLDQDPLTLLPNAGNFPLRFAKYYKTGHIGKIGELITSPSKELRFEEGELTDGDIVLQSDAFVSWKSRHPAATRAEIIVPDLIQEARIAMTEACNEPEFAVEEARYLLFATYHCIASLVDEQDLGVIDSGQVDSRYLCG